MNSKIHRVSVCNSAETLLVHRDVADDFLPRVLERFAARRSPCTWRRRSRRTPRRRASTTQPATDDDWAREYLSLDLAVRVVDSLDEAIDHIRRWSSGHTEAIVTESQTSARRWVAEVDAAAVMVNASTRFTDGGEFGFGAEIGISTQKLHARGPMGLPELTTTKWVVTGDGQIRSLVHASEVRKLVELEDQHWWYRERRHLLARALRGVAPGRAARRRRRRRRQHPGAARAGLAGGRPGVRRGGR